MGLLQETEESFQKTKVENPSKCQRRENRREPLKKRSEFSSAQSVEEMDLTTGNPRSLSALALIILKATNSFILIKLELFLDLID
ncbi:hypothetical protein HPP92_020695 [Vanilla planifolia]|uniref:Uncharacterized protein n=1 Tax=Vanilla planifolia TaxID=51239 RepID=A0A835Q0H3_VANPL|nr:hypothetical protein HPP92_020695 [Vanilla planifolia]